jgi:hypothetical protein
MHKSLQSQQKVQDLDRLEPLHPEVNRHHSLSRGKQDAKVFIILDSI